jgi:hypothetical protein
MQHGWLWIGVMCVGCGGVVSSAESSIDGGTISDSAASDSGSTTTATGSSSGSGSTGSDAGSVYACAMPGMCTLAARDCCGYCGPESFRVVEAISRDAESSYHAASCVGVGPCPPICAPIVDPNLAAFCRGGSCTGIDVRVDEVSDCLTNDDCQLQNSRCCGPCGGAEDVVAIAKTKVSEYMSQICDPRVDCGGCPLPTTTGLLAFCNTTTHHCAVGHTR